MLNDFTDRVYPDLDHQELFEQHQKKVEIEKEEAMKRKEEYLRLKAIAQAEKEAQEKAEADLLVVAEPQVVEGEVKQNEENAEEEIKEPAIKR